MTAIALGVFLTLFVCACLAATLWLIGNAGDRTGSRRINELRARTPYTPPANTRAGDFDRLGRPY